MGLQALDGAARMGRRERNSASMPSVKITTAPNTATAPSSGVKNEDHGGEYGRPGNVEEGENRGTAHELANGVQVPAPVCVELWV